MMKKLQNVQKCQFLRIMKTNNNSIEIHFYSEFQPIILSNQKFIS
jgi:hypothetical protein